MTTEEKFRAAVNVIRSLPKNGSYQPSHDLMLRFYGYYKQATEGPCTAARPKFWDYIGKLKWEAWNKLGNMSREEAMNNYVEELKKIVETMSYTDNVANFLGSLGAFYDSVPAGDLELLVGPIIERMRSQPGSPLNGSPFGSREASPDRVQSVPNGRHFTSSLETSPASSYSASPLPPDAEDEDEEEEFIDTVEAEPERIIKDSSVNKVSIPMAKKSAYHNGIPNGYIPSATMNGHHDEEVLVNGNGVNHERGRTRERSSPLTKGVSLIKENGIDEPCTEGAPTEVKNNVPSLDQRHVAKLAFSSDISEPIAEAVKCLQQDLEKITGRLNSLEVAVASRSRAITAQARSNPKWPSWWPFSDISPRLFVFLVVWPFVAHATIAIMKQRRTNRLL